jgi:hypothetical protein
MSRKGEIIKNPDGSFYVDGTSSKADISKNPDGSFFVDIIDGIEQMLGGVNLKEVSENSEKVPKLEERMSNTDEVIVALKRDVEDLQVNGGGGGGGSIIDGGGFISVADEIIDGGVF